MTSPSKNVMEDIAESALAEIIANRTLTRPHDDASGMSKREHFAACAITGLATESKGNRSIFGYEQWLENSTRHAVFVADALIEALNATDTTDQ